MTIYHYLPKSEIGEHDFNNACLCEPERIPEDENDQFFAGEVCYRHNYFTPLPPPPDPEAFMWVADLIDQESEWRGQASGFWS